MYYLVNSNLEILRVVKTPIAPVEAAWAAPVVKVMIQVIVNIIAGQDSLNLCYSLKNDLNQLRERSD